MALDTLESLAHASAQAPQIVGQGIGQSGSLLNKHLKKGETSPTGVVEFQLGKYAYFCRLNPTPHYTITVQ